MSSKSSIPNWVFDTENWDSNPKVIAILKGLGARELVINVPRGFGKTEIMKRLAEEMALPELGPTDLLSEIQKLPKESEDGKGRG